MCNVVYRGSPAIAMHAVSHLSACFFFGVLLQNLTHSLVALASGYLQGSYSLLYNVSDGKGHNNCYTSREREREREGEREGGR